MQARATSTTPDDIMLSSSVTRIGFWSRHLIITLLYSHQTQPEARAPLFGEAPTHML